MSLLQIFLNASVGVVLVAIVVVMLRGYKPDRRIVDLRKEKARADETARQEPEDIEDHLPPLGASMNLFRKGKLDPLSYWNWFK